jgi:hypothetical protein
MKFYIDKLNHYYWDKIRENKLTAIYFSSMVVWFLKNGEEHNTKNAAADDKSCKEFYLNGEFYGYENDFTKQSWRRFVKLKAFL